MPEMVLHGRLVDGQHVGAKPRLHRMRAECAERDGRGERKRGNSRQILPFITVRSAGRCAQFVYNEALTPQYERAKRFWQG